MKNPCYLGVDLGGTQLRMAAVSAQGNLLSEVISAPTGPQLTPDNLSAQIIGLYDRLLPELGAYSIAAIGAGTAGVLVDNAITQSDNLPLLNGCDLKTLIASALKLPVEVDNDANCFALAEARFGAGRGAQHLVGVTLGTGVGSGVIINGCVHRGANGAAGEVFRIPLRDAHLEYFLSGAGVVRGYVAAKGAAHGSHIDAARVAELARKSDPAAVAAWESFAADLHFLCECIIAIVDPEVIVIGGSIAQARDLFDDALMERLSERPNRVAYAELGTAAGVIGAAALNI
ncbi:MAG: ROK family protein [Blastocatellales bacterium]|nr:ROK family protein [Blastocatellales bacterium]